MACFHPTRVWFHVDGGRPVFRFPVGENPLDWYEGIARCRWCVGCKADRARDISIRAAHEARMVGEACFLTLTYDREHLPWHTELLSQEGQRWALAHPRSVWPWQGSLCRRDAVLFMKRLRKALWTSHKVRVRGYLVGEYGGRTMRPHYHVCLFGHAFYDDRVPFGESKTGEPQWRSAVLDGLWSKGFCTINEMGQEVAQYAAKYAVKAQGDRRELRIAPNGSLVQIAAPFDSLPHGKALGTPFLGPYWSDVFPRAIVVLRGGVELPAPAAYMRVLKERDPELFERIVREREVEGLKRLADFMPSRLAVREEVAIARHAQSKRDGV